MAAASPEAPAASRGLPRLLGRQPPHAGKGEAKLGSEAAAEGEGEEGRESGRQPLWVQGVGREEELEIDADATFCLQAELGRGAFGSVYSATHRQSGRLYALKLLRKDSYEEKRLMPYALTERHVHAWVRHPYILGLHLAFQTPSLLVLVLPYCPGGSLVAHIRAQAERRLPEDVARLYLAEMCLAVAHLHHHGIVHRDVKAANVVLDEQRHAMLTDFGLSKEGVVGATGAGSFAGTPQYLPPEVLERRSHGTPVDVYCLGALLFEMLTGAIPFWSDDDAAANTFKWRVCHDELEMPSFVSESAARFVWDCMARNPAARGRAEELSAHAFFQGIDFEQVLRREVSVPSVSRGLQKKRSSVMQWIESRLIDNPFLADDPFGSDARVEGWDFKGAAWDLPREGSLRRDSFFERGGGPRAGCDTSPGRAACLLRFWQCGARGR